MACVGSTEGFHPEIVPSSVTNRKWLGPDAAPDTMTKSSVGLKTRPVGAAGPGLPVGGGIVTTSGWDGVGAGRPFGEYTVATPIPLSATHTNPVSGFWATPHGFTRLASVRFARAGRSDTRFVCLYARWPTCATTPETTPTTPIRIAA